MWFTCLHYFHYLYLMESCCINHVASSVTKFIFVWCCNSSYPLFVLYMLGMQGNHFGSIIASDWFPVLPQFCTGSTKILSRQSSLYEIGNFSVDKFNVTSHYWYAFGKWLTRLHAWIGIVVKAITQLRANGNTVLPASELNRLINNWRVKLTKK